MVQSLDLPALSFTIPSICQSNDITAENISSMWSVFSKCKDHLENGRRLENLSWRIWFRESLMIENCHYQKKEQEPMGINDSNKNNGLYNGTLQQQQTPISIYHHHHQQQQQQYSNVDDNEDEDNDYFRASTSAGSSMKDSAVSGCDRSVKRMSVSSFKRIVSSLGSDHSVEEARTAYENPLFSLPVTKPTAAETTRLSDNGATYNSMEVAESAAVAPQVHYQKVRHQSSAPVSWNNDNNIDNKLYLEESNRQGDEITSSDRNNGDEENMSDDNENKQEDDDMDSDTLSEWSAQDDDTVFADDDDEQQLQQPVLDIDHQNYRTTYHWEFRKQAPKENDHHPKESLLSIMFKKHQEQVCPENAPSSSSSNQHYHQYHNHHHHQRMLSTASSSTIATITNTTDTEYIYHYYHNDNTKGTTTIPINTNRAGRNNTIQYNNNNNNNNNNIDDLSESLQFSVDWERRQNVSSPVVLLQKQQRRLPAFVATSRATATCTTTAATPMTSWVESFRGW